MGNKVLFAIINPKDKMVSLASCEKLKPDALKAVGLDDRGLDFGSVAPRHSICVFEFGLFAKGQHYFSIDRNLYAGNAVIFQENDEGVVTDVCPVFYNELLDKIRFYNSSGDVEKAMLADEIRRPSIIVGEDVLWAWNQEGVVPERLSRWFPELRSLW